MMRTYDDKNVCGARRKRDFDGNCYAIEHNRPQDDDFKDDVL